MNAIVRVLLCSSLAGAAVASIPAPPGRVAVVSGDVHLLPDGGAWRAPHVNSVFAVDDVVRTGGQGRVSLELSADWTLHLDERSEARITEEAGVRVVELWQGQALACSTGGSEELGLRTRELAGRVAPGAAARLEAWPGLSRLVLRAGAADVSIDGRRRTVEPGRPIAASANGVRAERERPVDAFEAAAFEECARLGRDGDLGRRVVGASELVGAGRWVTWGGRRAWVPHAASGWAPYGDGCFRHDARFGWVFVPHAGWGWVTHHHGSWAWDDHWGWVWIPDAWGWAGHRASFWRVGDAIAWCPRPPESDGGEEEPAGDAPERRRLVARAPVGAFERPIVPADALPEPLPLRDIVSGEAALSPGAPGSDAPGLRRVEALGRPDAPAPLVRGLVTREPRRPLIERGEALAPALPAPSQRLRRLLDADRPQPPAVRPGATPRIEPVPRPRLRRPDPPPPPRETRRPAPPPRPPIERPKPRRERPAPPPRRERPKPPERPEPPERPAPPERRGGGDEDAGRTGELRPADFREVPRR